MKLGRDLRLIAIAAGLAVGVLVLAGPLWFAAAAHSATTGRGRRCSNAIIKGAYAIDRTGWLLTGSGPAQYVPYGEIGIGHYDGAGNISGTVTVNVDGHVTEDLPFTGTYTVNPDCTGTNEITPQGSSTLHNSFVVFGGGQGYVSTQTDSTVVVQTRIERVGPGIH